MLRIFSWSFSFRSALSLNRGLDQIFRDHIFSRLRLCYVTFCNVSASYLAWARNASGIKFRVKCKFFNFTSPPDTSPVRNASRLPPAQSASYSDSESCSGHVFSMLSLQIPVQGKSGHKPAMTWAWILLSEMRAMQNCLIYFVYA